MAITLVTEAVSKPIILQRIEALAAQLRRRQLVGSRVVAIEVVKLIREVVAGARFGSFVQLTEHLEEIGQVLQNAGPKELVITNMTRRILKFLHEEYATALGNFLHESNSSSYPATPWSVPPTPSIDTPGAFFPERGDPFAGRPSGGSLGTIFDLLGHKSSSMIGSRLAVQSSGYTSAFASQCSSPSPSAPPSPAPTAHANLRPTLSQRNSTITGGNNSPNVTTMLEEEFSRKSHTLKPVLIEAIEELMDEVRMTYTSVAEQSIDHIHSGEFILTIGQSRTVEEFLKAASRKRRFTVIVAETAPSFSGRATALALSSFGITTILIPDSNSFALLPRCSKVLLGPHAILADGALLSIAGSLPLCLAANRMRVPVVIVGGMFKFSPIYLGDADWGMRDLGSPEEVLGEVVLGNGEGASETEVLNPYYDIVPAEIVSLYITNLNFVRFIPWVLANKISPLPSSYDSGGHPSSLLYRLLSDMYGST